MMQNSALPRLDIAFCAVPMLGHLIPLLPYAEELARHGHTVTIFHHSDSKYRKKIEESGLGGSCKSVVYDEWSQDAMYDSILSYYNGGIAGMPDIMVYDFFAVAAADAADTMRIPAVGVFPNPRSVNQWAATAVEQNSLQWKVWSGLMYILEGVLARILWCVRSKDRWSRGLPLLPEQDIYPSTYMPRTIIGSIAPTLEFEDQPLAPRFHMLGPSIPTQYDAMSKELVDWIKIQTKPIVYVAFGTQYHYTEQHIKDLQAELLETNFSVLWSLPERHQMALADDRGVGLPSHWRVQSFFPQVAVLHSGKIHAFVSHCGSNSVGEALLAGVPIICCPGGADQPANASRLARAGVGIIAKKRRVGPAFRELLANFSSIQEKSQRLAAELRALDAAKRGADIIEESARFDHVGGLPANLKGRWPIWPLLAASAVGAAIAVPLIN